MTTPHTKAGFTLVELTVSIGIFVVVFAAMMQIFFVMQGTIARINAQREMTAWMSTMIQTIATDFETAAISVEQSDGNVLVLTDVSTPDRRIVYRTNKVTDDGMTEILLQREVVDQERSRVDTFRSPLFALSEAQLVVTPSKTHPLRCSILPALQLRLTLAGRPGDTRLAALRLPVETAFSSNANPQRYAQECLASSPTRP